MLLQKNPKTDSASPGLCFSLKLIHFSPFQFSDMRCSELLLFASWGLFVSVSGSPAVEQVYRDVVDLVSPGQQHLTAESHRSVFNSLENRVQCGEVSCEKVSFIRLTSANIDRCLPTAGEGERSGSEHICDKTLFP